MSSESPEDQVAGGTDTAEAPSDAALLDAVRDGDADAYDVVYRRHVDAARRLARVLAADQAAADDLVAESFARLLTTLKSGGGPEAAVRAYLLTTMRRVHIDSGRAGRKTEPVEEVADYERPETPDDPAVTKLDQAYAAQAFAGLPERWQAVLWHIEVEGESPADVAPLLGLNPNAVSAVAYRARERLRQLYLQQHLATVEGEQCSWCSERLGAYVRDKLGSRESGRVREHLDECDKCRVIYLDLVEVNSGFRFLLAPVVLGSSAVPYLAAAGKSVGLLGVFPAFVAWWKNASRNPATAVAATVVLVLALGVTAWATVGNRLGDDDGGSRAAQSSQPTGAGGTGGATAESSTEPSSSTSKVAETRSEPPTSPPTSEPTSSRPPATAEEPSDESEPTEPAAEPTTEPTSNRPPEEPADSPKPPTTEPTEQPTAEPTARPTRTRRPVCVRIPILKVCLGGDRSGQPSEVPSRGRGRP